MKLDDFRKLKKLMEQTTSDSDGEAVNALRAANRILKRENLTWTRVLDRSVSIAVPFESAKTATGKIDEDDLDAMFEVALEHASGGFRDMLEDIHDQWERRRSLSPRQRQVVVEAAERASGLR